MRRGHYVAVAAFWISGLCTGTLLAVRFDPVFSSMMRRISFGSVSIVWILMVVFPFLITAAAVLYNKQFLIYICAFVTAIWAAFVGQSLRLFLGSAGWLLQPVMLFPLMLVYAVYCWFALRADKRSLANDLIVCLIICVCAVVIDFYAVSPFLTVLFDH